MIFDTGIPLLLFKTPF